METPRCDAITYRQLLGKGDTLHDFCDRDRIRDKLNYGIQQGFILPTTNTNAAAVTICTKVNSLLSIDTCGIESYDENYLLKFFYGEKPKSISASEESIQINYYPNVPNQHLEYQIPYTEVPSFIKKINALSSAKYVMDYTYLSPFLCGFGINTIGKAYDRTTTNEGDECNKKVSIASRSVLKKEDGELFFFDEIYTTTDDMTLEWSAFGITGIIDIHKMMEIKSRAGLENLTTAIIAFHQSTQPITSDILYASNDIIKYCYGLDIQSFTENINLYLLALTDLKRIGDLLQVKLAKLLEQTFVSNDRMAILLATIGYNHPSIRTSKTPSDNDRSDRIIALYNFNKSEMEKKLEVYNQVAIEDYNTYVNQYLRTINVYIKDSKMQFFIKNLNDQCQQILGVLSTYPLNPSITKSDILVPITPGQRIPRHYNPKWLNREIIIKRGLFVYVKYITVVLKVLFDISSVKFTTAFIWEFNQINIEILPSNDKLSKIRQLFNNNMIPHPNTLFKTITDDNIQLSLRNLNTFVNSLSGFLDNIDEVTKIMQDNLPMPLFGEPIEYYKNITLKLFKDLKPINLAVNIENQSYQIGLSSNPEKTIEGIIDLEKYFTELVNRYNPQQGGRHKKISKSKRGGQLQSMKLDSLIIPDNIVDQTLGKLIVAIYEAESQGQKDIAQNLFVSYMQLQLLTQQFNISLPIVGEATPEEIAISNQKITAMITNQTVLERPFSKTLQNQNIPRPVTLSTPMTTAAAAAGGNKKTKSKAKVQPVKGGKSKKKDEVKKK
uniref:Uncharacterized protein n=1 Tax=viral metagenome TaxID=1070528 RepID=A0A6C0CRW1_9ZZZZ